MHFHLPRRHRRKLFFPPGLLALAGLLWLGCVALGPWRERVAQQYVMQLTMPINEIQNQEASILRYLLPNPKTVCKTCSWTNVYLSNKSTSLDTYERKQLENIVHTMMSKAGTNSGVRIHLTQTARFKHLVFALDVMNRENVKRYWLDIHHTPTILYGFNPPPVPQQMGLDCLKSDDIIVMPYERTVAHETFREWVIERVTKFWQFDWAKRRFQLLQNPEWRWPVVLLVALAALSSWRIVRMWRVGSTQ